MNARFTRRPVVQIALNMTVRAEIAARTDVATEGENWRP
jgi:hypothetical protein